MPRKLHYFLLLVGILASPTTERVHSRRRTAYCTAGFYSAVDAKEPCTPCAQGYWSLDAYFSCQQCNTCQPGFYVTQGCEAHRPGICAHCEAGTFSNQTDLADCYPCVGDTWSKAGATECTDCNTCPPGTFVHQSCQPTIPRACTECSAGTYSNISDATQCSTCPPGTYSTKGAAECTPCAPSCDVGHFIAVDCTSTTNKRCQECPAGQYAGVVDSPSCTPCESGWWSSPGESECHNCTDCHPGHQISSECTSTKDRQCEECPKGTYEDGENSASCSLCSDGINWSEEGASACTPCAQCQPGHYQNVSCAANRPAVCAECPAGKFTGTTSQANLSYCQDCPSGSWSVEGASVCTECETCPIGTFKSQDCTATTARKCTNCPAGTHTSSPDQSTCTECNIDDGYYSFEGASQCETCTTCQSGHYIIANCTSGSNSTNGTDTRCADCDAGYYAAGMNEFFCTECTETVNWSRNKASKCNNCTECEPGHFVSRNCTTTMDTQCSECPSGKYAAGTNELECLTCPNEMWSSSGASECTNCTTCDPGFYASEGCDGDHDRRCAQCDAGTYTSTPDQTQCTTCPDDTWSFAGAGTCTECATCQPGYKVLVDCEVNIPRRCKQCSFNEFSDTNNADECKSCAEGKFSLAGASGCTKIA